MPYSHPGPESACIQLRVEVAAVDPRVLSTASQIAVACRETAPAKFHRAANAPLTWGASRRQVRTPLDRGALCARSAAQPPRIGHSAPSQSPASSSTSFAPTGQTIPQRSPRFFVEYRPTVVTTEEPVVHSRCVQPHQIFDKLVQGLQCINRGAPARSSSRYIAATASPHPASFRSVIGHERSGLCVKRIGSSKR